MNNIIFSDWYENFKEIHNKFKQWWHDKIHVLADFDRTLTKNFFDWEEKPSLVSVLRREWILWKAYTEKATELAEHYYPLEISPELSYEEKKKYMDEWWHKHMQLLVDTWIKKSDIKKALWLGKIQFRDGVKIFLELLSKDNIPLVIISANALGTESIQLCFEQAWFDTDNIDIISNEFEWDENWKAIWYKKPVIHVFNKDETVLAGFPDVGNKISTRTNIVLLWDSEGDPGMVEWFNADNVLKIWFLNKDVQSLKKRYQDLYDVIICDDGNLNMLNTFLENI